jgi:hypothetical protein
MLLGVFFDVKNLMKDGEPPRGASLPSGFHLRAVAVRSRGITDPVAHHTALRTDFGGPAAPAIGFGRTSPRRASGARRRRLKGAATERGFGYLLRSPTHASAGVRGEALKGSHRLDAGAACCIGRWVGAPTVGPRFGQKFPAGLASPGWSGASCTLKRIKAHGRIECRGTGNGGVARRTRQRSKAL